MGSTAHSRGRPLCSASPASPETTSLAPCIPPATGSGTWFLLQTLSENLSASDLSSSTTFQEAPSISSGRSSLRLDDLRDRCPLQNTFCWWDYITTCCLPHSWDSRLHGTTPVSAHHHMFRAQHCEWHISGDQSIVLNKN